MRILRALGVLALTGALTAGVLTACAPSGPDGPDGSAGQRDSARTDGATPGAGPIPLAAGLDAPWSVLPLDDGGALISQRDDGRIIELTPDGEQRDAGTVPDVVSGGEAGLHGLAQREGWLYAYHGASDDNRVVRMPLTGDPGSLTLDVAGLEVVIDGIPRSSNHNGGRIAFGPDGMLYVSTGDAGDGSAAQDPTSLGGKVLRLTPEGDPAPGNPFGTAVYSLGHRNVQGLAWDSEGTLWASEFGQNTWDELNRIEAGGNYGWPEYEGAARAEGFIDPLVTWTPSEASPSGIAIVDDVAYVAGLRGERMWAVDLASGDAAAMLAGELGRLRDVTAGPDGTLWVLTNNTDGRGSPRDGDDRLLQVTPP